MVNNNSEFDSTLAVIQIDEEDLEAVYAFICALNSESGNVAEPSIVISEYKTDTKTKIFGKIQKKLEEWDNEENWTLIDDVYYLKYLMEN